MATGRTQKLIFPRTLEVTAISFFLLSLSPSGCLGNNSIWSPFAPFPPPHFHREGGDTTGMWNGFFIPPAQPQPCWLQTQGLLCEATTIANNGAVWWLCKGASAWKVPGCCVFCCLPLCTLRCAWAGGGGWFTGTGHVQVFVCVASFHFGWAWYESTPTVHDTGVTENVVTHWITTVVLITLSALWWVFWNSMGAPLLSAVPSLCTPLAPWHFMSCTSIVTLRTRLEAAVKIPNIFLSKQWHRHFALSFHTGYPNPWPFLLLFSMPFLTTHCPPGKQGP